MEQWVQDRKKIRKGVLPVFREGNLTEGSKWDWDVEINEPWDLALTSQGLFRHL